jgi:hypothetical protein
VRDAQALGTRPATVLITARTSAGVRSLEAKSDAVVILFKPLAEEELLQAILARSPFQPE